MNGHPKVTPGELDGAAEKLERLLYHDHAAAVRRAAALLAHLSPVWFSDGVESDAAATATALTEGTFGHLGGIE
jgi:hypothetical protein